MAERLSLRRTDDGHPNDHQPERIKRKVCGQVLFAKAVHPKRNILLSSIPMRPNLAGYVSCSRKDGRLNRTSRAPDNPKLLTRDERAGWRRTSVSCRSCLAWEPRATCRVGSVSGRGSYPMPPSPSLSRPRSLAPSRGAFSFPALALFDFDRGTLMTRRWGTQITAMMSMTAKDASDR